MAQSDDELGVSIENRVMLVSWATGVEDGRSTDETDGLCDVDKAMIFSDPYCYRVHNRNGLVCLPFYRSTKEGGLSVCGARFQWKINFFETPTQTTMMTTTVSGMASVADASAANGLHSKLASFICLTMTITMIEMMM